MGEEYRLSYTGKQIDERLSLVESSYYFTDRKEFANASTLKTSDIYTLYENLGAIKNPLKDNDGNIVNYEFVFTAGDYGHNLDPNVDGRTSYGIFDNQMKKPTFLVMSGIHGSERTAVLSTYRFFEDLVNRKNLPAYFPEGAIFKVVPVATPFSFDSIDEPRRTNANSVNINRNFDYKWRECNLGNNANYSGPSVCSESETQAITNWLKANTDATLLLDMHTSAQYHQIAVLIGPNRNSVVTKAKSIGLRGIDKVVPFWKDQIGYATETIYPYSSCADGYNGNDAVGMAVYYASEVLGIPSLALECSCQWDGIKDAGLYAEAIATCAEVLGNILLESYKQEVYSEDLVFEKVAVEFVQGNTSSPTVTNRLVSNGYIETEGLLRVITNNPIYEFAAYFYELEDLSAPTGYTGAFVKEVDVPGWVKDHPTTTKIKLLVRRNDNSDIVPIDVAGNFWLVYKAGCNTRNFVSFSEKQNLSDKQQALARKNVGVSFYGIPYSNATAVIDLSNSVKMYLFATPNGYDVEVVGEGAIPDQLEADRWFWKEDFYDEQDGQVKVDKINRLHIGEGITSIGDYFMYKAYNLEYLTFANSKAITHLGTKAFAYTSISGEYDFTGITDTKLDAPFMHCPKLVGLTFHNFIKEIAEKAFQMCISLRYVTGLTVVSNIGNAAFQYCTTLESIDVRSTSVTLGDWVFILTPIDAKANGTILSDAEWKGQGNLCFVPNEWTAEQLTAIRAVTGESMQMPIPESDNQGTDFYTQWGLFPWIYNGAYKGMAHPASGCCGIFSLYHIYNILHPNAQYDTFYDWMMRGVVPNKIEVTQSLYDTLSNCEYGQLLIQGNTAVSYEVGSEITARDLPMALDADTETWGTEGTSFWGVCTALGWTGTEMLFESGADSGANVKQAILDSLANNKPVMMEIVGAGEHGDVSGHGMHAVVAIGYDADTDRLLIIDSTGGFDADVVPLVYWCKFESLITPHSWSAIWTFDFGEVITMTDIDNKLDILLASTNSGFHSESGVLVVEEDAGSVSAPGTVKIPCTSGGKLLIFTPDDATLEVIKSSDSKGDGTRQWVTSVVGQCITKIFQGTSNFQYRSYLGNMIAFTNAGTEYWFSDDEGTICDNTDGFSFTHFGLKAGTYNWTVYYWNE